MLDNSDCDELLVSRVVAGETGIFAELLLRYELKLHRYITYLIHDNSASSDVLQEVFIKVYKNLRGFDAKLKFSSWIYRIAHNEAMNYLKKHRNHTVEYDDSVLGIECESKIGDVFDQKIVKADVRKCLDELNIKYRDVVQLIYFENMKYEEASDVLKIPISTVGVRLSRAKKELKKICQKNGVRL